MKKKFILLIFFLLLSVFRTGFTVDTLDVSLEKGTLLLTPRHGGNGSAWGLPHCESCHVISFIHQDAPKIREIVRDKGYRTCTGCHGGNGTETPRECGVCHNPDSLPTAPILSGEENHNFAVGSVSSLEDNQCLTCHIASDMDGNFEVNTDLTVFPNRFGNKTEYRNTSEFCIRCHNRDHQQPGSEITGSSFRDPLIAMDDNYHFIDIHSLPKGTGERTYSGMRDPGYRYGTIVDCTDCHTMHGTHNDLLIIDRSDKGAFKLDPALRLQPVEVNVDNGDYSQLCVLCHKMDVIVEDGGANTGNGLDGVHEVGTDCRVCHTHGRAVQVGL